MRPAPEGSAITDPVSELHLINPNRIVFGWGATSELPAEVRRLGIQRPLVVADPALEALGRLDRLGTLGAGPTFSGIHGNTTEADVLAGLAVYRSHDCDGVVAVGGGSAIDAAKLIRLLATHDGPLETYEATRGGGALITNDLPPMIAVPTTAGTGSEVGRAALVTLAATGWKSLVVSPHLVPDTAVLDPDLTMTVPPVLTSAIAFDGLSHCIEELFSPRFQPIVDVLAAAGIRLIHEHLLPAVRDGADRGAREALMLASLYGGIGLQKGLGGVHALSHPLAAIGAHHGTLNAILLPHVLRYNIATEPAKARFLGELFGAPRADAAIDELRAACGLPSRLSEVGLAAADIPRMASRAIGEPSAATNPRPIDFEAAKDIYAAAL